ncbi:MAG: T9SS C-terminal target domain-containing protein [Bacteroidetes bacterium]|nr:MAG: T9SS C-terminal target domain-containing protein [Bacteroidota bacterium]
MIRKFYHSCVLAGLMALGVSFEAKSQNTEKTPPLSFSPYFEKVIAKSQLLETTIVPPLDMKKVEEDMKNGIGTDYFAKHLQVDFDLQNSGEWRELPNGDRVWRLKVHSAGAFSLQPFFGEFNIPQGSKFYVYDNMNRVYGAFNEESNRKSGDFIVPFVDGNFVTLEYFEPSNQHGKGKIKMTELSYGYKNVFARKEHGFENETHKESVNESNACNININCVEGADWQVHKRAVAGIVMRFGGSSKVCSGSLINNTNLDKTPYFITAWHCWGADNTAQWNNWQFRFNYEALGCENPTTAPIPTTLTGCVKLEDNVSSDYMLLQLNANTAQVNSVNPYFVGWDSRPNIPTQVAGIHHPAGDIKKYSENTNVTTNPITTNSVGMSFGGGTVPLVIPAQALFQFRWTRGWMEGGSSGSVLFDQNKRLVGTLTGGTVVAACNNSLMTNSYGRFSKHWENNGIIRQSLAPAPSTVLFLDGLDPNNSIAANVGVTSISSTIDGCAYSNSTPITFTVRNFGNAAQSNIPVSWTVKNLTNNTETSGNLIISGTLATTTTVTRTFNADLSSPGVSYLITVRTNLAGDGNPANDQLQGTLTNRNPTVAASNISFSNITSTSMTINFTGGNARNRMVVMKQGSALTTANYPVNGNDYPANSEFQTSDPIGGNAYVVYKGRGSQASVTLLTPNATYFIGVFEYDCEPVFYLTSNVPTGSTQVLSVEDKQLEVNLKIYPNPASEFIQIELNDSRYENASINFTNTLGKSIKICQLKKEGTNNINEKISLQDMPKGMYILEFSVGKAKTYKKVIVN